jgi:hypothetical protein
MKTTLNFCSAVRLSDDWQSADIEARHSKCPRFVSTLVVVAFFLGVVPASVCEVTIDPKASYVLTNEDPGAIPAVPISLTSLGIGPGDTIQIQTQGDFSFCFPTGCPEIQVSACGVFSSNATLLPANNAKRVVGAVPVTDGVVSPCVTGPTLYGQLPTDIQEDSYWTAQV